MKLAYNEISVPLDNNVDAIKAWCLQSLGEQADIFQGRMIGHRYPWATAYKRTSVSKGARRIAFRFYRKEDALMFKLTWL